MRVLNRRVVGGKQKCWCGGSVVDGKQRVLQDWKMLLLFCENSFSASTGANSTKLVPMDSPMRVLNRRVVCGE